MTCDDVRDRLSDRIDGALDAATEAVITSHLATCAACQRELAGLERTVAGLRALGDVHAPAGFVDRVLARARPEPWTDRLFRAVFLPLSRKLPLEAAAVVLVGILTVLLYRGTPDLERAGDQVAVREHAAPPVAAPVSPVAPSTHEPPAAPPAKEQHRPTAAQPKTRLEGDRSADGPRVMEKKREAFERTAPHERTAPQPPPPPLPAPAIRQEMDNTGALAELGKQKAAGRDTQLRAPPESPTGAAESTAQPGVPAAAGPMPTPTPPARGRSESGPPLMERTAPTDVSPRASRKDETRESAVLKSQAAEPSGRVQAPGMRGQVRPAAPAGAMTAALPPPLRGVLRIGDRTASERAMRDLFGRLGATAAWDRPEPSVLTISAPKGVLGELLDGLRELGELRMEPAADELPDRVTLLLRLAS